MQVYFTLSTGRSGTRFLSYLARNNLANAVCRHEPYFDIGNPNLFGPPIYDRAMGRDDKIRPHVERKRNWIAKQKCDVYFETNHAFLKSFSQLAFEYFPNLRFVHLVRNPQKTARSEANREKALDRWMFPFRRYRGDDGKLHFRWGLCGHEPIFKNYDLSKLSLFQWYVVQWIEIENRAMQLLDSNNAHDRCYTFHSPGELNDPEKVKAMCDFFGLKTKHPEILIKGKQNRTPGFKTVVDKQEEDEFRTVIDQMPAEYLAIFRREPYTKFPWISLLHR